MFALSPAPAHWRSWNPEERIFESDRRFLSFKLNCLEIYSLKRIRKLWHPSAQLQGRHLPVLVCCPSSQPYLLLSWKLIYFLLWGNIRLKADVLFLLEMVPVDHVYP